MKIAGLAALMFIASLYHPIHVSVTNIDMEPDRGIMELSVKIFADDFQDLIFEKYSVELQITEQVKPGTKIDAVNKYIGEALELEINGKTTGKLEFIRSELNEEAIWLHYRYNHGNRIRKLGIRNTIMLEKFDDQTNLLILAYENKQNGYRLNNKNTELSLSIK